MKRLAICLWCLAVLAVVGFVVAGHLGTQWLVSLIAEAQAAPRPQAATYAIVQVPGGYRLCLAGEVCPTPESVAKKVDALRLYCAKRGIELKLWVSDPCPCHCAQCDCPDPCPCGGCLVPGPKVRVGIDLSIARHLHTIEKLRIRHKQPVKDRKLRQKEKK